MKSLYLLLDLFTISVPLLRSFEPKIRFVKRWPALFVAIGITGAFFVLWDVLFTHLGVWGFNDRYLLGVRLFLLPIEEWMFFVAVPFACMFVYEVLNYFVRADPLKNVARPLSLGLAVLLVALGLASLPRLYTSSTALLAATMLLLQVFVIRGPYLGRFYLSYLVSLVPFFIMNGILTGSFTDEPVVWYDDTQNLGLRLGTIPVEDSIYLLLLLLMETSIYEWRRPAVPPDAAKTGV